MKPLSKGLSFIHLLVRTGVWMSKGCLGVQKVSKCPKIGWTFSGRYLDIQRVSGCSDSVRKVSMSLGSICKVCGKCPGVQTVSGM